jgi:uncharacterized protein (DUF2147 family)
MKRLALLLSLVSAPVFGAEPVTGQWLTDERDGIVEIGRCGDKLCGRLARSLVPIKGPPVDRNNPDPALRNRPIIGLPVLLGFVADGGIWRGQIYDPRRGRHYRATLERLSGDRLKVRGCISVLCRTIMWTRAK